MEKMCPGKASVSKLALLLSVMLSMSILMFSCTKNDRESKRNFREVSPLLLLAVDGLEWSIMRPLLERGDLPTIARLMKSGTYGYLQSMEPTLSPVIWTSIATGKVPEKHGIRHFVYEVEEENATSRQYYTSSQRETKAFWNILSDYGRTVHSIGWWITYPAESINGLMVSQTNTINMLKETHFLIKGGVVRGMPDQVHPPEKQNEIMSILDETERSLDSTLAAIFQHPGARPSDLSKLLWDQSRWTIRADATYLRIAKTLLKKGEKFDVLAVFLGGADVVGHRFWRYAFPEQFTYRPSSREVYCYGEVIRDYYRHIDRSINDLVQLAPANATIVIISDHGMHVANTAQQFDRSSKPKLWLSADHEDAPPGVFIACGGHITRSNPLEEQKLLDLNSMQTVGGIMDILPTLLTLMDIPLALDLDGNIIEQAIDPEWLKSRSKEVVDTYDSEEWLAARRSRLRMPGDQEERLDQLRSLGYIQ